MTNIFGIRKMGSLWSNLLKKPDLDCWVLGQQIWRTHIYIIYFPFWTSLCTLVGHFYVRGGLLFQHVCFRVSCLPGRHGSFTKADLRGWLCSIAWCWTNDQDFIVSSSDAQWLKSSYMAQSLHIDLYRPSMNLPFGICAIYSDLKVLIGSPILYCFRLIKEKTPSLLRVVLGIILPGILDITPWRHENADPATWCLDNVTMIDEDLRKIGVVKGFSAYDFRVPNWILSILSFNRL